MDISSNLDRIEIVLCDTQDGANIGSVCRAMKTMGLTHLTLVTDRIYDEERIHTLALHAYDLYENRKEFTELKEAISDSILSVAATRRIGKSRRAVRVNPTELASRISVLGHGKVSIVFGCESNGLSDEQVRACSMIVTIPTSDKFPSLNLSQAVQIICYSLFQNLQPYSNRSNIVSSSRIGEAVSLSMENLQDIGYFKNDEEKLLTSEFLKSIMERAGMTESEVKRMEKIFSKTRDISIHKTR